MQGFLFVLTLLELSGITVIGKRYTPNKGFKLFKEDGNAPLVPERRNKGPGPCEQWIQFNGTAQSETIQSPGYPFNYGPNLRCFYFVTSPPGTQLALNCADFNLEASPNDRCDYDSFRFSLDGDLTSAHRMFSCGMGTINQVSVANRFTVFFSSDNANVRSIYPFRFSCTIRVIGKPNPTPPPTAKPIPQKCSCGERKLKKVITKFPKKIKNCGSN